MRSVVSFLSVALGFHRHRAISESRSLEMKELKGLRRLGLLLDGKEEGIKRPGLNMLLRQDYTEIKHLGLV